jgi:hypothetical protein
VFLPTNFKTLFAAIKCGFASSTTKCGGDPTYTTNASTSTVCHLNPFGIPVGKDTLLIFLKHLHPAFILVGGASYII